MRGSAGPDVGAAERGLCAAGQRGGEFHEQISVALALRECRYAVCCVCAVPV
jgi:hypothetical protein